MARRPLKPDQAERAYAIKQRKLSKKKSSRRRRKLDTGTAERRYQLALEKRGQLRIPNT
jgi:hypothetical protein